ncbi:MFS transporter [Sphingobium sp. CR2-8]|uniref:MFS transporter n=1 Tax=Sphingobium sp. CR2-8 TaxID=1306534 RepID=UPI002DB616DB|nr:MFS transporter [Sphingobium sp. CR2-8]MEC3909689.1 MFS transporter [Sphingobium sp. CR2-8]
MPNENSNGSNDAMPVSALLALAMTGFICIATETLPAGLLPQISSGMGISSGLAGQTVTAYAIGSLIAAIPLSIATQGLRRRSVLLLTIVGFLIFNSITALSHHIVLTMTARFMAGMSAGLAWSLLAGYARRMVAPEQQGRAMAIAMVGTPVALSLGVPFGTWLGSVVGWRSAFGVMSFLTIVLILWVLAKVPDYPGQLRSARMPIYSALRTPGVRPVLGVVISWMLAHNILYTYVAPFVTPAGLANHVDLVLLIFGMAALAGIWVTGKLVDHFLRLTVLASLAFFGLITLIFALDAQSAIVIYAGTAVWGLTFGGAATLLQTALADAAGASADTALAMNVVAWNGAIAAGGIAGGFMLETWGATVFPWAMFALILVGFMLAWSARAYGFPAGSRTGDVAVIGH